MADYIDRLDVIKIIRKHADGYSYLDTPTDSIIDDMKAIPSEDISPMHHAKWEYDSDGLPMCSYCNEIALQRIMLYFPASQYFSQFVRSNFCPHCGARMDGET